MVGLMRLFIGVCQHIAQGTVLAVMLPPMSLPGVLVMKDRAKVLWKICTPAFFGYAVFSYLGAIVAFALSDSVLSYVFGAFLIFLGLRYAKEFVEKMRKKRIAARNTATRAVVQPVEEDPEKAGDDESMSAPFQESGVEQASQIEEMLNPSGPHVYPGYPIKFNYITSGIIGSLIGIVGGMFGVGAGVLMVPVFTELCGVHKDDARTLSLLILLPPVSIGAVIKYEQEHKIDWPMAGVLLALYFSSNALGARAGRRANPANFKLIMGMMLAVLGVFIILLRRFSSSKDCEA